MIPCVQFPSLLGQCRFGKHCYLEFVSQGSLMWTAVLGVATNLLFSRFDCIRQLMTEPPHTQQQQYTQICPFYRPSSTRQIKDFLLRTTFLRRSRVLLAFLVGTLGTSWRIIIIFFIIIINARVFIVPAYWLAWNIHQDGSGTIEQFHYIIDGEKPARKETSLEAEQNRNVPSERRKKINNPVSRTGSQQCAFLRRSRR
jgi:hypothetical protein